MNIDTMIEFNKQALRVRPSRLARRQESIVNGIAVMATAVALLIVTPAKAAVPAFPGAQGGGAVSVGGRGGVVIKVTNLNDSGAGSLRACVEASGPRTCVFTVGGEILLNSELRILNPFITIAGQTAPGGGITLKGPGRVLQMMVVGPGAHDTIIRYIRIRKGFTGVAPCNDPKQEGCGTNLVVMADNVIVDHVSSSWNQDEGLSTHQRDSGRNNVTFSYNLVAEALSTHSTGWLSAGSKTSSAAITNIDLHHNLTMSTNHRNPLLRLKSSRVVNNLWYNHRRYATHMSGGASIDMIGNKYKRGPLNPKATWHEIGALLSEPCCSAPGTPSLYLSGNVGWHQTDPAGDQYLMTNEIRGGENGADFGPLPADWKRDTPLPNTTYPIIAEPVANIEASILPTVGASRRLDCDGAWIDNREAVDTRLVSQYIDNTGISTLLVHENDVGGYPPVAGGTPCTDTDGDGMPNVWETANGLDPDNPSDRNTLAANGYTNLENYLNGATKSPTAPARLVR
ncbi:MAG: hypothetical protein ACREF9_12160 [Opitutaceae bacterium]